MNRLKREGQATLGFRPEHVLPSSAYSNTDELHRFPFRIQRIENLGSDRLVYGELQPPMPASKAIARIPSTVETTLESGIDMEFAIKKRHLISFDPSTHLRLQKRTRVVEGTSVSERVSHWGTEK